MILQKHFLNCKNIKLHNPKPLIKNIKPQTSFKNNYKTLNVV